MATEKEYAKGRTLTTAQAQAEGLRVFVAGIPWALTEDTLKRDFEECGTIEDLFLIRDKDGNSTGKSLITFREKSAVEAALKYDQTDYGGRTIYVKMAEARGKPDNITNDNKETPSSSSTGGPRLSKPKKVLPSENEKPEGCRSLCIKNLGEATEDDLRLALKDCAIQSIRMVKDRTTGESRGIAFVDFRGCEEVDKAMEHNGDEIHGRAIEMHYEAPRHRPRPEGCMTVAVKKLHPKSREVDLLNLFKGLKSITDVRVIQKEDKTCSGLAFVEFSDPKDVEAAVQRDGMKLRGQIVFICYETKEKKGTSDRRKLLAQKHALKKRSEGAATADGEEKEEKDRKPKKLTKEKIAKRNARRKEVRLSKKEAKKAEKADGEGQEQAEKTQKTKKNKEKQGKTQGEADPEQAEQQEPAKKKAKKNNSSSGSKAAEAQPAESAAKSSKNSKNSSSKDSDAAQSAKESSQADQPESKNKKGKKQGKSQESQGGAAQGGPTEDAPAADPPAKDEDASNSQLPASVKRKRDKRREQRRADRAAARDAKAQAEKDN
mmetsp:Transcript_30595/g.65986  ORF Transcript_30595/g.65986 Transcript_30595/m.65986 type:complete len:547 (+) Transcript_30595:101-1741(+)